MGVFMAQTFAGSMACFAGALFVGECWLGLTLIQVKRAVRPAVQGKTVTLVLSIATICSDAGPAIIGFVDSGTADDLGWILRWFIAGCLLGAACLFLAAVFWVKPLAPADLG